MRIHTHTHTHNTRTHARPHARTYARMHARTHTHTHTQSSLIQCLLGELQPQQGSVEVCGMVSYASQQSWIFSGTLRDNVLFGLPFREDWYQVVIQACALDKVSERPGSLTIRIR